jgi:hypothetical protein
MITLLTYLLGLSIIPLTTLALFEIRGYFYIHEPVAMVAVWSAVMGAYCLIGGAI